MSAALSLVDVPLATAEDPRVRLRVAMAMTDARLLRLADLEGDLVDILDAIDAVRDEIERGQRMQITLLHLIARSGTR